jgi:hypothetical protein
MTEYQKVEVTNQSMTDYMNYMTTHSIKTSHNFNAEESTSVIGVTAGKTAYVLEMWLSYSNDTAGRYVYFTIAPSGPNLWLQYLPVGNDTFYIKFAVPWVLTSNTTVEAASSGASTKWSTRFGYIEV